MAFEVATVRSGSATILSCRGRLVAGQGAAALRGAARRELSAGRLLALDLAGVTQLDARGVGILAEACDVARQGGARILLVGANGRIRRLLRLTHLDTIIQELAADGVRCYPAEIESIESAYGAVSTDGALPLRGADSLLLPMPVSRPKSDLNGN